MRADPDLAATLRARARILRAVRDFFDARGFLEVSTPCLERAPDPALHLDLFETFLSLPDGRRERLFLHTSPEHHLKRMVAAGMGPVYEIKPFFRNGEITRLHNPEFTGLEWYQLDRDIQSAMRLTEELVTAATVGVTGKLRVDRDGRRLDLSLPFRRMSVREALEELAGVRVPPDWNEPALRDALASAGIQTAPDDGFDDLVNRALLERVEPHLDVPTFLFHYPAPMAAQARRCGPGGCESERFELFIGGIELCNGYGELTDPDEMRERFEQQRALRRAQGKTVPPLDADYLGCLARLPACCGCALGLDRLVMVLCNKTRIADVMPYTLSLDINRA